MLLLGLAQVGQRPTHSRRCAQFAGLQLSDVILFSTCGISGEAPVEVRTPAQGTGRESDHVGVSDQAHAGLRFAWEMALSALRFSRFRLVPAVNEAWICALKLRRLAPAQSGAYENREHISLVLLARPGDQRRENRYFIYRKESLFVEIVNTTGGFCWHQGASSKFGVFV